MGELSQEQINVDLFNEVQRLKGEKNKYKEALKEAESYIRLNSSIPFPARDELQKIIVPVLSE